MKNLSIKKIILSSVVFLIGVALLISLFIKMVGTESKYYIKPITAFKSSIVFIKKNDVGNTLFYLFRTFTIAIIVCVALTIISSILGIFVKNDIIYKIYNVLIVLSILLVVVNFVFSICFSYELLMYYNNVYHVKTFSLIPLIIVIILAIVYYLLFFTLKENQISTEESKYSKYKQAHKKLSQYKQLQDLEIISKDEYEQFKSEIL